MRPLELPGLAGIAGARPELGLAEVEGDGSIVVGAGCCLKTCSGGIGGPMEPGAWASAAAANQTWAPTVTTVTPGEKRLIGFHSSGASTIGS
jgi:hypothetical protein